MPRLIRPGFRRTYPTPCYLCLLLLGYMLLTASALVQRAPSPSRTNPTPLAIPSTRRTSVHLRRSSTAASSIPNCFRQRPHCLYGGRGKQAPNYNAAQTSGPRRAVHPGRTTSAQEEGSIPTTTSEDAPAVGRRRKCHHNGLFISNSNTAPRQFCNVMTGRQPKNSPSQRAYSDCSSHEVWRPSYAINKIWHASMPQRMSLRTGPCDVSIMALSPLENLRLRASCPPAADDTSLLSAFHGFALCKESSIAPLKASKSSGPALIYSSSYRISFYVCLLRALSRLCTPITSRCRRPYLHGFHAPPGGGPMPSYVTRASLRPL